MAFGKIKIRPVDKLFSTYIRTRSKWKCEHCGKYCGENNSLYKLECSHHFTRSRESTRFDPENCVALCFTCHNKFHDDKGLRNNFMIQRLGQQAYDLLELRSHQKGNKDDALTKLYINKLMEELKKET
jgi:5-methylcytosine-specific restriction endonuclease McrA